MAFITSLRIKNFFSIKNEVIIDFKASPYNIENNPERLFEFNGEYYNKVISFYGANASGKTTVLKAITTIGKVIKNERSDYFEPSFKNKFSNIEESSELEISFVIDSEEFQYTLLFKSDKYENVGIEDEKLFSTTKDKVLFQRKKKEVVGIDDNIKETLFNSLNNKKSLMVEFYKFDNTKKLDKVYTLFLLISRTSNINSLNTKLSTTSIDEENIADFLDNKFGELGKDDFEKFLINFFLTIGQDIIKIEAKFKEEDGKKKEFLGLKVYHKISNSEPLEFGLESDGSQMLMKILQDIFIAKVLNTPLVIDEFDSILHPVLVPIIINLLIENDIQIIYSTHNIYNMQFLQNDEIFLLEKDMNHITTIKAVKDNDEIKGYKNLLTLYENGYLGGLPSIKEIITKIL